MIDEAGDEHEHEHEHDGLDLEIDTQSQIFLEMRGQNLELLRIAAQVAGFGEGSAKPGDLKKALKDMWEIYSEFYTWVDPEESDDDDDEE